MSERGPVEDEDDDEDVLETSRAPAPPEVGRGAAHCADRQGAMHDRPYCIIGAYVSLVPTLKT
eukprot:3244-Eustigmatos_ZCMA.PRE.1